MNLLLKPRELDIYDIVDIKEYAKPGSAFTWQLILSKRGDINTVKLKAVDEG